ncbi:neutral cholesterol ester hydrolase 1-like [Strongylocentrotus purpuratus]|uniref:Alpha/beta hydrolase fold-3 domain-containing protein n=1 Tax=Strongylocentrotus purpuratus TaxID=7668 RepID=A0A7M7MZH2_STRPU|nr:neutral cholesterol ester hydrolase 1-like [Strongylocentrotus purpuratus]
MREDLRGLPEAYILTAEYDVLRDDSIMYAKRLEKAGVPVTWKHYPNGFHSMFSGTNGVFWLSVGRSKFMSNPFDTHKHQQLAREAIQSEQAGNLAESIPYTDTVLDGVPVRIFAVSKPEGRTDKRPAIVFYHGGGWVMGSPVGKGTECCGAFSRLPTGAQISVSRAARRLHSCYGLVPEAPERLHVDPTRIAVMGDSSGGNLAAAVAQRLTFDQTFDFTTPSYQRNGNYWVQLNKPLMTMMWSKYLGKDVGPAMKTNKHTSSAAKTSPLAHNSNRLAYEAPSTNFGDESIYNEIKEVLLDPDYAPLMREDLRGLPEAYILTAEYDILRDDGIMYAKRLEKAGVPVTLKDYLRGFHGMFGTGPVAR